MGVIFEALGKALVTILIVGFVTILYYYGLNKSDKKKIKKREIVDLFVAAIVLAGATVSLATAVVQAKYMYLLYFSILAVFVSAVNLVKKYLDLKDKLHEEEN
ncbi:hypothetical protein [Bacillus mycoides]|uniref:hypothetical protein n=1 Tax=Bacillus mycoides TaxID=1405 RepID=UPI001C025FE3|nr:hypothetical protein [Bacillus mycoides]QWG59924.1 hypothetical protein EXW60_02045 [Bacillus mycoides]QWJ04888.1 hypothetical protein J5V76_18295 [Bacillus mycoides]